MNPKVNKKSSNQNGRLREVRKASRKVWDASYEPGDIAKMIKATGISEKTLRFAKNFYMCSPETEEAINSFFASKKQLA